jgi:hypothetical protein
MQFHGASGLLTGSPLASRVPDGQPKSLRATLLVLTGLRAWLASRRKSFLHICRHAAEYSAIHHEGFLPLDPHGLIKPPTVLAQLHFVPRLNRALGSIF